MAHIYTGLDIGNGYIKIVVVNANNDSYYVLATTSVKTSGLKKNVIYDEKKWIYTGRSIDYFGYYRRGCRNDNTDIDFKHKRCTI